MTPEEYNSTYGLNLSLRIIEEVKRMNGSGIEATNRSVSEAIAQRVNASGSEAVNLRNRVRAQVLTLEASGRLKRKEHRDRWNNVYYKTIEHVG